MKLKYLKSDYIPKGDLYGFPLEVIDKMIERQVKHGNPANVKVFEDRATVDKDSKGFTWSATEEGSEFWGEIVTEKAFDLFFKKYPKEEEPSKEEELPLPRIIEVIDSEERWVKRVCFLIKNNKAHCWVSAETLEEAEKIDTSVTFSQWREVQEESKEEYKPFNFSDGIADYEYLIGKTLFSKNGKQILFIVDLWYQEVSDNSFINDFNTEFILENFTFKNGEPVGIKIEKNEEPQATDSR